jgi:hypothetical protein
MNPSGGKSEETNPERASEPCVPVPGNAFSNQYLQILRDQDDVEGALEATSAGPFKLVEVEGGLGLFRLWESPEAGFRPLAVFADRATALRFMVVWSVIGRERTYRASQERGPLGVPVESAGTVVGYLNAFNDELLFAAHVVDCILKSPAALAALLEAAGPLAQEIAGQILARTVEEKSRLVVGR